jgi:hypothetical protein
MEKKKYMYNAVVNIHPENISRFLRQGHEVSY